MDRIDQETGIITERYIDEDDYQEQKEKITNLENNCSIYRENCEDLIKAIENVELLDKKFASLVEIKNCIKKDLVTTND